MKTKFNIDKKNREKAEYYIKDLLDNAAKDYLIQK